jgi:hypothetical protein
MMNDRPRTTKRNKRDLKLKFYRSCYDDKGEDEYREDWRECSLCSVYVGVFWSCATDDEDWGDNEDSGVFHICEPCMKDSVHNGVEHIDEIITCTIEYLQLKTMLLEQALGRINTTTGRTSTTRSSSSRSSNKRNKGSGEQPTKKAGLVKEVCKEFGSCQADEQPTSGKAK